MRLITLLIVSVFVLQASCTPSDAVVFKEVRSVTCTAHTEILNPDCGGQAPETKEAGAATIVAIGAASAAANAARRKQEREANCKSHPMIRVCSEWTVVGGTRLQ